MLIFLSNCLTYIPDIIRSFEILEEISDVVMDFRGLKTGKC